MAEQQRSQREQDRQAEANRRKLLAAETAVLLLLLRRRDKVIRAGIRAGSSAAVIAANLESSWLSGLVEGRSLARSAGVARLVLELKSLGLPDQVARNAATAGLRDALRARQTARSMSGAWRKYADANGIEAASRAALPHTRRAAATESAEAYNTGRLTALRGYPNIKLLRVYDAVLDRQTCPVCESNDGQVVGVYESFSGGEPGTIHPNCRCTWRLVAAEETK